MVLSKLNMSAMSSNKELKEPPILARTHWYCEEIRLESLLKSVLTAFLCWSQVVPSVVLPYREPLSDHDSWRYFDILCFWNQKWNWWNWCKIVWLINHRGTESRAISRNGHLLQLLAAEHAEDRDIRRFHCTTDFFTEVEYWIQQSSLLAITWSYGTVILKKNSVIWMLNDSHTGEFSDCDVADGLNDEDWWSFTMIYSRSSWSY